MSVNDARIAVMTGVAPYQVQIVGESVPLNIEPIVLDDIVPGDFVWCQFFGQQLVVLGRIGDGATPQLGSTEDLNTLVYTGRYGQPLNANTSLAHNYPDTLAGMLEVFRPHLTGDMIHQRYSTYNNQNVWWRTYYGGGSGWNRWVQIGSGQKANISVVSGWTVRSGYGFTVTQLGNHTAMVNGNLQNTSGSTQTGGTLCNAGGFPAWACAPVSSVQTVAVTGNSVVGSTSTNIPGLEIHNDGSATIFGISLANNGFLGITGIINTV